MVAQLRRQVSQTVTPTPPTQILNIQRSPLPKWYGTPLSKPMFLAQVENYKSKAYYSSVSEWSRTTLSTINFSVYISADMLSYLPRSLSSMFLNYTRFSSNSIAMLSHILSHLNPSSSDNLLLTINDLNYL